ncbi:MAPEG family protein [Terasakiella sp. A23]|uniref:MAPEG family protein n=1 Tax=Terasakiella sp. FCG-A23 TaxID=3080561 RepID=UPI002954CFCE|nr:MAPEG family protein [Terasakiella sp. A23]MDV7339216.1 MAPEG family protein [Terasakiella sp. A23]
MTPPLLFITPIYAVTLTFMLFALTVRVIKTRRTHKVSLMDGGVDDLKRIIRAHGNFTEYVPLVLILMAVAEINGAPEYALYGLGSILLGSRLIHAAGLIKSVIKWRIYGMYGTFTALSMGAILVLSTLFQF